MADKAGMPPASRRIYLQGVGSQVVKRFGSSVYRSPTLRRTKSPTKYQRYATATLGIAARFVSLAQAWEYEQAKIIAGSSGFTWKDVLISGFFGNAIEFTDVNGVQWTGRRILAAEIQALLDSISSTPGSVIVRTANGWAALYPGTANQVLTIDPVTALPNWNPSQAPQGKADLVAQFTSGGTAGDLFASLGYFYKFALPCTIKALSALLHPGAAGRTYTLNVAPFNPATMKITAAPTIVGTYTAPASGSLIAVPFTLTTPLAVNANDVYAFWISQTFGSATTTPDTYFDTTNGVRSFYFTVPLANGLKLAKNAPTTTDTWTAAAAAWCMSFLFEI